ncbi:MAG: LamG domain-containing protein [Acidobacteria bacterium]|nr:LamG domain-containing protein [Acidobacteriota bacterium]
MKSPRAGGLCSLLCATLTCAADLKTDLTFRAGFDGGADAQFARGDKRLYTAPSYKEQSSAQPGIGSPDVELASGQGRRGDALRFKKKNTHAIFYKAEKNIAFDPRNWTGTISFWLNLDPDQDLEPGFCDPIQVTDKAYNDSAIWVDFTRDDKPRHFRLGVFGELKAWNPQNLAADKNPDFDKRLVVVRKHPFARGQWTHVAVVYSGLGSGSGKASLYLEGKLQRTADGIREPFAWDLSRGAIRLGVNYVGLMDDVAVFRRALAASEIEEIAKGRF